MGEDGTVVRGPSARDTVVRGTSARGTVVGGTCARGVTDIFFQSVFTFGYMLRLPPVYPIFTLHN